MASTLRTWIISTAAVTGVVGGGAVGLAAAAPAHDTPVKTVAPPPVAIDTSVLQAQVQQLLAEDQALRVALSHARSRLSSQVVASEASLRAIRSQLAAAQAALAATRRAAVAAHANSAQQTAATQASRPSSHTTTGASGATGASGESDDGSHDD